MSPKKEKAPSLTVERVFNDERFEGAKIILFGEERVIKRLRHAGGNVYEAYVEAGDAEKVIQVSKEHKIEEAAPANTAAPPKSAAPGENPDNTSDEKGGQIPKAGDSK